MSELNQTLERLAEVKSKLAEYELAAKPLTDELETLKQSVMEQMQESQSKRTEAVNGYYVIRAERSTVRMSDEKAVSSWIVEQGLNLDEYRRLDATRVKLLAESALKETGELIPGVDTVSTEYLTIKAAKG